MHEKHEKYVKINITLIAVLNVLTSLLLVALGVVYRNNTSKIKYQLTRQANLLSEQQETVVHAYKKNDDYYIIGSYPQTLVGSGQSQTLTEMAPDVSEWTSYGYYIDGEISDAMRYYDLYHDSAMYRGVYFTRYRSAIADEPDSELYLKYTDSEDYQPNTIYWFRYEPIVWRVLTETDDNITLYADMILDTQEYNVTRETIFGHQASDYEYSSIRKWLNYVFYATAFNEEERSDILPTFYDCDSPDCVSLLSLNEVEDADNGFNPERYKEDPKRAHESTDYAISQHPYSNSYYWLRSQYLEERTGNFARMMTTKGALLFNHDPVTGSSYGVVPVITIAK